MAKVKLSRREIRNPDIGPVLTPRFVVALILILGGIGWIAFYYLGVRPPMDEFGPTGEATGPAFARRLGEWNYLIGFGAFFLGLIVSAHRSTPLGRGRGVVVGMLGCFLLGLVWICVFYAFAGGDNTQPIPVLNDLGQRNLFVGIAAMAVGFAFATKWE